MSFTLYQKLTITKSADSPFPLSPLHFPSFPDAFAGFPLSQNSSFDHTLQRPLFVCSQNLLFSGVTWGGFVSGQELDHGHGWTDGVLGCSGTPHKFGSLRSTEVNSNRGLQKIILGGVLQVCSCVHLSLELYNTCFWSQMSLKTCSFIFCSW